MLLTLLPIHDFIDDGSDSSDSGVDDSSGDDSGVDDSSRDES